MPPPAVTLTFDLLNYQYVSIPGTYMTQFWEKYLQRYCIHPVFQVIACCEFDV